MLTTTAFLPIKKEGEQKMIENSDNKLKYKRYQDKPLWKRILLKIRYVPPALIRAGLCYCFTKDEDRKFVTLAVYSSYTLKCSRLYTSEELIAEIKRKRNKK